MVWWRGERYDSFIQHWYSNDEWFQMLWGRLIPSFYPINNIFHPKWSTLWSCSVGKASWGFRSGQYLSSSQSITFATYWLFTNQIVPGMRQRRQRKRRRSAGNSHLQSYSGESSLGSHTQIFLPINEGIVLELRLKQASNLYWPDPEWNDIEGVVIWCFWNNCCEIKEANSTPCCGKTYEQYWSGGLK